MWTNPWKCILKSDGGEEEGERRRKRAREVTRFEMLASI
jgi:hypothetical protein